MKKITQNFTNVKVWQSIMVAFIFLLSLTTFSQGTQVTIGTGTIESEELPIEPYYGYSYSQN